MKISVFQKYVKNCRKNTFCSISEKNELSRYLPEISVDEWDLIWNCPLKKISDDCQGEFLDLKSDSGARDLIDEKSITEQAIDFWFLPKNGRKCYPLTASIYVCKCLCFRIFNFLQIKSKKIEIWKRPALRPFSSTSPRFPELVRNKQSQVSHWLQSSWLLWIYTPK